MRRAIDSDQLRFRRKILFPDRLRINTVKACGKGLSGAAVGYSGGAVGISDAECNHRAARWTRVLIVLERTWQVNNRKKKAEQAVEDLDLDSHSVDAALSSSVNVCAVPSPIPSGGSRP